MSPTQLSVNCRAESGRWVIGAGTNGWHFGPLHPLSHGRLLMDLEISEQLVSSLHFTPGFMHRGDEKLLEVRDFRQGLSLLNRHNWLSPASAEVAYAQACEELMGLAVPARAVLIRDLIVGIGNLTGRLLRLAAVAMAVGQDGKEILVLRETWIAHTERLTGTRMHSSIVRLGGVAVDISAADLAATSQLADDFLLHPCDVAKLEGCGFLEISGVTTDGAQRIVEEVGIVHQLVRHVSDVCSQLNAVASPIETKLSKSIRVPIGQSYIEQPSSLGITGIWLHSDGGKSPARVAIRSQSAANLAFIQSQAIGQRVIDLVVLLLTVPLALGELDR